MKPTAAFDAIVVGLGAIGSGAAYWLARRAGHRVLNRFRRRTLPGIDGPAVAGKTCLYTLTPDRDFVLDTLPAYPRIALALGAGQMKHPPASFFI